MYNTLMKKLIWGVRQFAILNLHFFDWETACFIICQAARNGSGRQKNGPGYPPGFKARRQKCGHRHFGGFFFILNIYHNPVILNID